jgi:hypothetical protein
MTNSTPTFETQSRSPGKVKRLLGKALEEMNSRDLETAETLIELAIFENNETALLIDLLVNTLVMARGRLEISNYAGEEDDALRDVQNAVVRAKGAAI